MTLTVTGIEVIEVTDPQGLCQLGHLPRGYPVQPYPTQPNPTPTPWTGNPIPLPITATKWEHKMGYDDPDYHEKWTRGLNVPDLDPPKKWAKNWQSKMDGENSREARL